MARSPIRTPGEGPAPQEAQEAPLDHRTVAAGIPDFRQKSVAYAMQWFADNPGVTRRNVLTAEGWYVHPDAVVSRQDVAGR